jgi:hypothetical protein
MRFLHASLRSAKIQQERRQTQDWHRRQADRFAWVTALLLVAKSCLDTSYYDILEVPIDADMAKIRTAYRRLALKKHPGKHSRCMLYRSAYLIFTDKIPEVGRRKFDTFALHFSCSTSRRLKWKKNSKKLPSHTKY